MILLKGIFFIFLIGLLLVAALVLSVVLKVYRLHRELKKQGGQSWEQPSQQKQERGGTTTVTDRRDPARASRKIFSDDEGEYIDYEEE